MPVTIKVKKFLVYSLNVAFTIMEGLLLFRLLLKMLAANSSPFVNWIYNASDRLLRPFEGMFPPFISQDGHVLEFTTVFTIAFYGIMYYFIFQLIILLADVIVRNQKSNSPSNGQSSTAPNQPPTTNLQ